MSSLTNLQELGEGGHRNRSDDTHVPQQDSAQAFPGHPPTSNSTLYALPDSAPYDHSQDFDPRDEVTDADFYGQPNEDPFGLPAGFTPIPMQDAAPATVPPSTSASVKAPETVPVNPNEQPPVANPAPEVNVPLPTTYRTETVDRGLGNPRVDVTPTAPQRPAESVQPAQLPPPTSKSVEEIKAAFEAATEQGLQLARDQHAANVAAAELLNLQEIENTRLANEELARQAEIAKARNDANEAAQKAALEQAAQEAAENERQVMIGLQQERADRLSAFRSIEKRELNTLVGVHRSDVREEHGTAMADIITSRSANYLRQDGGVGEIDALDLFKSEESKSVAGKTLLRALVDRDVRGANPDISVILDAKIKKLWQDIKAKEASTGIFGRSRKVSSPFEYMQLSHVDNDQAWTLIGEALTEICRNCTLKAHQDLFFNFIRQKNGKFAHLNPNYLDKKPMEHDVDELMSKFGFELDADYFKMSPNLYGLYIPVNKGKKSPLDVIIDSIGGNNADKGKIKTLETGSGSSFLALIPTSGKSRVDAADNGGYALYAQKMLMPVTSDPATEQAANGYIFADEQDSAIAERNAFLLFVRVWHLKSDGYLNMMAGIANGPFVDPQEAWRSSHTDMRKDVQARSQLIVGVQGFGKGMQGGVSDAADSISKLTSDQLRNNPGILGDHMQTLARLALGQLNPDAIRAVLAELPTAQAQPAIESTDHQQQPVQNVVTVPLASSARVALDVMPTSTVGTEHKATAAPRAMVDTSQKSIEVPPATSAVTDSRGNAKKPEPVYGDPDFDYSTYS